MWAAHPAGNSLGQKRVSGTLVTDLLRARWWAGGGLGLDMVLGPVSWS